MLLASVSLRLGLTRAQLRGAHVRLEEKKSSLKLPEGVCW